MAFQGPLNLRVPRNEPGGRWGRSILASRSQASHAAGPGGGGQETVEMADEAVGKAGRPAFGASRGRALDPGARGAQSEPARPTGACRPAPLTPARPTPRALRVHRASSASAGLIFKTKPKRRLPAAFLQGVLEDPERRRRARGTEPRSGCHGGHRLFPRPPCSPAPAPF